IPSVTILALRTWSTASASARHALEKLTLWVPGMRGHDPRRAIPESANRRLRFDARFNDHRLALALAALREPRGQPIRKSLRRQPKTGFNFSVAYRQRIVELRGVGEIAHAELV